MATYSKGLVRRVILTEGSARTVKSYKAKVASLTSERAGLQALIREMTEELVKHRSDLKHISVARAWAEDKEKEAQKDAKVAEDELRLVAGRQGCLVGQDGGFGAGPLRGFGGG